MPRTELAEPAEGYPRIHTDSHRLGAEADAQVVEGVPMCVEVMGWQYVKCGLEGQVRRLGRKARRH